MLIFLGCCARQELWVHPGHNSTLTASERHSAVPFLLNCVNLPAQDDGHQTPNSITTHPFRELKLIFIKQISLPLLCQIAHQTWGGSVPNLKVPHDEGERALAHQRGSYCQETLLLCKVKFSPPREAETC
jgi:hypothetical protein